MTVIAMFSSRVAVQVSEYSKQNCGSDAGTVYMVEALFPDGKWSNCGMYYDLDEANEAAQIEAKVRDAELLAESCWPNRKVTS